MNHTKHAGFTLLELLVVISIIGLLSTVVLSALSVAREKAKAAVIAQTLHEYKTALNAYFSDYGHWPTPPAPAPGDPPHTCLGHGVSVGGVEKCLGSAIEDANFNAQLDPYFKGTPNAGTFTTTQFPNSGGQPYGGVYYQCSSDNGLQDTIEHWCSHRIIMSYLFPIVGGSCPLGGEFFRQNDFIYCQWSECGIPGQYAC